MSVRDGNSVTIRYVNFVNSGTTGCALVAYETVLVENCSFSGSRGESGSAIYLNNTAANSVIRNCNFTNNYGNNQIGNNYAAGGAVCVNGPNVEINNCYFSGNLALNHGGALTIRNSASNTRVIACTFLNNYSPGGGAIYNQVGTTNITGCTFTNNRATSFGGAIYSISSLNVVGSSFNNNNASNGGSIYSTGVLGVSSSNFTNNRVTGNGGAIYLLNSSSISNSNFISNSANNGGTLFSNSVLNINGCNFNSNKATGNGGALYVTAVTKISSSKFVSNNANYGSAIFNSNNLNLISTSFSNNKAKSLSLSVSLRDGVVDYKGNAVVYVSLNVGDNVADAIYSSGTVTSDNKIVPKNSKPINQKIILNFKNKNYSVNTNSKGVASFSLSGFNVKGTNKFNVIYRETSLYTGISKNNIVDVSQKTTNKNAVVLRYVLVKEYVIYNFKNGAKKLQNVKKIEVKKFNNESLITYTMFNNVKTPRILSKAKNVKISYLNYPTIVYPSYKIQCSCGRIGYTKYGSSYKFVNKCTYPKAHTVNNKKCSTLVWNPKKVTKIEGEWTCSGCGADYCAVSGYIKIKSSKVHLKKA